MLADLDGRPLLEHAIRAQTDVAELERVVVVLGSGADRLIARVQFGRAEPVLCADWESGQAASLRCGVQKLSETADKVIVTLGDEPLISSTVVAMFAEQPAGARAVYSGRPGHPAVLGPEQLAAIPALSGDRGAGALLNGPQIECSTLCSGEDVDTPEDLEAIRHEARAVL